MCVNWSGTEAVAMGTKRGGGGVWPRLEPVGPLQQITELNRAAQSCMLVKMLRGSKKRPACLPPLHPFSLYFIKLSNF